jgi:hypothetical protein
MDAGAVAETHLAVLSCQSATWASRWLPHERHQRTTRRRWMHPLKLTLALPCSVSRHGIKVPASLIDASKRHALRVYSAANTRETTYRHRGCPRLKAALTGQGGDQGTQTADLGCGVTGIIGGE